MRGRAGWTGDNSARSCAPDCRLIKTARLLLALLACAMLVSEPVLADPPKQPAPHDSSAPSNPSALRSQNSSARSGPNSNLHPGRGKPKRGPDHQHLSAGSGTSLVSPPPGMLHHPARLPGTANQKSPFGSRGSGFALPAPLRSKTPTRPPIPPAVNGATMPNTKSTAVLNGSGIKRGSE
jgi:hypothetical protein